MMSNEDLNSWACEIANDYAQARQEMGPEDFQEWEQYLEERMIEHKACMLERKAIVEKPYDEDDLPF